MTADTILGHFRSNKELFAFLGGLALIVLISFFYNPFIPETVETTEEVHVHSDFLMYILGQRFDLSDDQYQSRTGHILHEQFHLHDNVDYILHRHGEGITLATFLASLGITLTETCVSTVEQQWCTDDQKVLRLYVNNAIEENITAYVPQEADQILLYYGDPDSPHIVSYLDEITDEACIYSGTCPERGIPPPENCGLTCEL